jgi:uncharacterized protein YeaO (DUF488 family)
MPVRTKSLHDPVEPQDGTRVLIARFQPRGTAKAARTWSMWDKRLAPSQALFDAFRGRERKGGRVVARDLEGISWEEYARRFEEEMALPDAQRALGDWRLCAQKGETITLLCHCADAAHCHRTIVQRLLESE